MPNSLEKFHERFPEETNNPTVLTTYDVRLIGAVSTIVNQVTHVLFQDAVTSVVALCFIGGAVTRDLCNNTIIYWLFQLNFSELI